MESHKRPADRKTFLASVGLILIAIIASALLIFGNVEAQDRADDPNYCHVIGTCQTPEDRMRERLSHCCKLRYIGVMQR